MATVLEEFLKLRRKTTPQKREKVKTHGGPTTPKKTINHYSELYGAWPTQGPRVGPTQPQIPPMRLNSMRGWRSIRVSMHMGRLVSKSRRACVVASTWSSWGARGTASVPPTYSRAHGQCSGCGSRMFPASKNVVTAWARAVLLPSGSTGMIPGTACFSASMTGRAVGLILHQLTGCAWPFSGERPESRPPYP